MASCCISFLFDQYHSGGWLNKTGRQSAVLISHSYSCCSARAFVRVALMENNNCSEWHVLLIFRPSCYLSFALLHVLFRAEWLPHRYVCGDERRRENYFRSLKKFLIRNRLVEFRGSAGPIGNVWASRRALFTLLKHYVAHVILDGTEKLIFQFVARSAQTHVKLFRCRNIFFDWNELHETQANEAGRKTDIGSAFCN